MDRVEDELGVEGRGRPRKVDVGEVRNISLNSMYS